MQVWFAKHKLAILFALALAARVAFVVTLENRYYYFDTVHYDKAAKALIAGQGFGEGYSFSQFFRKEYALTPLYPVYLAAIYLVSGPNFVAVRIVESVLGACLCLLVFKIGRRVFNEQVGWWAGYFSAVFPHLIFLCGLLYVENLFTLLLALGVWFCLRWYDERRRVYIVLAGLVFGLACLGRPVVFAFYPFLAAWLLFVAPGAWRERVHATLGLAAITVLTLTPWTVRNYLIFGKITPVSAAAEKYLGESEEFLDEKIVADLPVAGDELQVNTSTDSTGYHFDFYYNGEFAGRLSDSLKVLADSGAGYAGLLLRGNLPNEVGDFKVLAAYQQDRDGSAPAADSASSDDAAGVYFKDDFERAQLGPTWQAPAEFQIADGALRNATRDDSWQHLAVCRQVLQAKRVALRWGKNAQARGVQEGGLALRLDRAAPDANGYLVWRQPAGKLLLFTIEHGVPRRQIATAQGKTAEKMRTKLHASINAQTVQGQSFVDNLRALVLKDPRAFFSRYLGEFIHFWKPMPDRFYSQNEFTVPWSVWLSAGVFTPVLVFFLLGLIFVPARWHAASLLLSMILSTALIYAFFMTKARYRMPVEPYMIIIACNALWMLKQKFQGDSHPV